MSDMDQAITATLGVEGGWSDHPRDPGGKTKYGITRHTYRTAVRRGIIAASSDGVKGIHWQDARKIYEVMYWHPVKGNELPTGLNALIFDFQVNSGQGGRRLQRSLNAIYRNGLGGPLAVDNAIGYATITRLNGALRADPSFLYDIMYEASARRFIHWTSLAIWDSFKLGWARRGMRILGHSVIMARDRELKST